MRIICIFCKHDIVGRCSRLALPLMNLMSIEEKFSFDENGVLENWNRNEPSNTFKWVSILIHFAKRRGYILMQPGEVLVYASRQLEPFEENYSIRDSKLAAVVFALKTWRHTLHEDGIQLQMSESSGARWRTMICEDWKWVVMIEDTVLLFYPS